MIAGRLTMRAQIERDVTTAKDSWGAPAAPNWQPLATVRCFAWSPTAKDIIDGDKVAAAADVRVMFALGTDVTEADEVAAITNIVGVTLFEGRLRVDGPVQYKHTHLEANLKRVG